MSGEPRSSVGLAGTSAHPNPHTISSTLRTLRRLSEGDAAEQLRR